MKVAVYSPYLDTAGGGEKYMLTIAEILSAEGQVDILLDAHLQRVGKELIKQKINRLHDIDLSRVNFKIAPISQGNLIERYLFLKSYDLFFCLTDGSIFYTSACKNIIHFQVPFTVSPNSAWGKFKQSSWDLAIYNSKFTKEVIEKNWQIRGKVIYPPVDVAKIKPAKKKNQILSVGRFFSFTKAKKHEVLIAGFKQLIDQNKSLNFSLHLAGGAGEGDLEYVEELKRLAEGYEIFFYPNMDLNKLYQLYAESKIYWHATGFGETDPAKMEHFGITTVEAMAGGCVPVVINLGGQKEIILDGENGFLWDGLDELVSKTIKVIKDEPMAIKLSKAAVLRAQDFSKIKFKDSILELAHD